MHAKYTELTAELYSYIARHNTTADDPLLAELRAETQTLGGISGMMISIEQGAFLSLLVAALGVRTAVEVGTFTGYSSLSIARGLPADGRLICCDVNVDWTGIARRYWERAGLQEKIELHLAPAADTLAALPPDMQIDFAFIDADKTNYDTYYELLLPRLRRNGVVIFDNMLRNGKVVQQPVTNEDDRAIDAMNGKLTADTRVESVLVPIADGLMICRKK